MKLKCIWIFSGLFSTFFSLLLFAIIFFSNDEDGDIGDFGGIGGLNIEESVLTHRPIVEKYCKEYAIEEYIDYILAIIQVESGGKGEDVMQSSESLGLAVNTLKKEESIKQGCKYFSELLKSAKDKGCDINTVVQSYNYGGGFIEYVAKHEKKYKYQLAENFAKEKSGGEKIDYSNQITIKKNGGWRYKYGNMFYVLLVSDYLTVPHFEDSVVQIIMNEAIKYQGWKYVFGGSNPLTSFDCSGLTSWCYKKADITLPRTAQEQYDITQHISLKDAKAGDLIFFKDTYDTGNYITHVGIYVEEDRMYHAGDPIGYTDLTTDYWQEHLVSAGRIKR